MITLKAALVAASAVGAVAVGGGATWAMTGSHRDAAPRSADAKPAAASRQVKDAAPAPVPTCLPARPGVPGAKAPDAGAAKKQIERRLQQNPVTKDLPKADLPKTEVPGVKAPDGSTKLPADLPTCAPGGKDLGKGVPAPKQPARVPARPGLPALPKLDCAKLKPAVPVGGTVEKTVMLAKGLRHVSTVPGDADLRKKDICAVTQKWAGAAGRWITVETLKTPAGMTQNQLRQAVGLPGGGTPVTVHGMAGYMGPGGDGVLLFDPDGASLFVNGSPVLAGGLKDVTAALRQAQ